jgi:hypothetical protein
VANFLKLALQRRDCELLESPLGKCGGARPVVTLLLKLLGDSV